MEHLLTLMTIYDIAGLIVVAIITVIVSGLAIAEMFDYEL